MSVAAFVPGAARSVLLFGSTTCRVESCERRYIDMLSAAFAEDPGFAPETGVDGEMRIDSAPGPASDDPRLERLRISSSGGEHVIESGALDCRVQTRGTPWHARITVRQPDMRAEWLAYHFWIVGNRLLALLGRAVLHAAALRAEGRTLAFAGPKGAGKSTLAVALARSGAVLLADDHAVVRPDGPRCLLSGCSARLRLTAKSKDHYFAGHALPAAAHDPSKAEVDGGRFFATEPHREHELDRIYFNRVGQRSRVRVLSRKETLVQLIDNTREMQRFSQPDDYQSYLAFLAGVAERVPAFDLELRPELAALDELPSLLRETT